MGTSNWQEAPGQNQNLLEVLYILSSLETPEDPRRSWRVLLGRGMSGFSSWTCCLCDLILDKRGKKNVWMDRWILMILRFVFPVAMTTLFYSTTSSLCSNRGTFESNNLLTFLKSSQTIPNGTLLEF